MFFNRNFTGSMFSLAARSSIAPIVTKQNCGWFGARHARAGPMFVCTAVCLRRYGKPVCKMYGKFALAPPAGPEVPHDSDCHAVNVPSLFAPTFTFAYRDGRIPATINS